MITPSISGNLPATDRLPPANAAGQTVPAARGGRPGDIPGSGAPAAVSNASSPGQDAPAASSLDQVQDALKEVREAIAPVAQNLLFLIDEDTGRTVVKVVDSTTDEVIRQIPSEEIIAIAKALDKLQGVLIQQKA